VHARVRRAERALGERHRGLPVGLARDVEPDEDGFAALGGDFRLHRAAFIVEHVTDDDLRALAREHLRLRRTHAARAATDERHFSREPHDRLLRGRLWPGVLAYARI